MEELFLQELTSGEESNAVRLAARWFNTFATDQTLRERLKLKATILNKETCEISPWVLKYNGKPAMNTISILTIMRKPCAMNTWQNTKTSLLHLER